MKISMKAYVDQMTANKIQADELAALRAQLAEAREGLAEANVIMQFAKHDNMKFYREWVDKYYQHLVTTA